MLGLSIVAAETVTEIPCAEVGTFRMRRIPRLAVGRYMPAWNDDRITLNGFSMHDSGMTSRTAFIPSAGLERLRMSAMAHDQPNLFHRRRKIARRRLGHAKNMTMATEADSGVHLRFEIVRVGRRPEYVDSRISDSRQDLVG